MQDRTKPVCDQHFLDAVEAIRLAGLVSVDPYQGRSNVRNVALAASGVGIYGAAMDQLLCNEGPGDPIGKRHARIIAVVDDDEGFRDALQLFLRTFALHVEAFASGEDFLRSSRLDAVGCVILDLAMPGMNGLEVKQQLAARGLQIPIVFVTAQRDEDLGQRASAAGALAVLRKPVDHEELVRLVREALRRQ
jgi:CheY-like chemotaxis protein